MGQRQSKEESPQEQTNLQEREEYNRNLANIFEVIDVQQRRSEKQMREIHLLLKERMEEREEYNRNLANIFEVIDVLQRRTEHQAEIMKRQEDINERLTSINIAMNSVVLEKMREREEYNRNLANIFEVIDVLQRRTEHQAEIMKRQEDINERLTSINIAMNSVVQEKMRLSEQRADEVAVLTEDQGSSLERARTDLQTIRRWKFPFFWRRKNRATESARRSTAPQLSEEEVQVHMDNREIESEQNSMEVQVRAPVSQSQAANSSAPRETGPVEEESVEPEDSSAENLDIIGMDLLEEMLQEWEQALKRVKAESHLNPLRESDDATTTSSDHPVFSAAEAESHLNRLRESDDATTTLSDDPVFSAAKAESHLSRLRESDDATTTLSDDPVFSAAEELDTFSPDDASQSLRPLALYEEALALAREGHVASRSLRTKLLECSSDEDFLAKLHCVRQAFQVLLRDDAHRAFFSGTGRQMITGLMHKANKSPEAFLESYEDMMRYIQRGETWATTKEEFEGEGVVCMNFFDIVLDFIVMGAFESLENQPSYIVHGIKFYSAESQEKKLKNACRSFLEDRRRNLLVPDGFLLHYYAICEHLSPVLAIGFLGPRPQLREACKIFKQQIVQYLRDMFDHDKVRFTTVQSLADDILRLSHQRSEILSGDLGISSL